MDQAAELADGALLFLDHRRSGKPDEARLRQDPPHRRVRFAELPAMALVDQSKDVVVLDLVADLQRGLELVDDGGDDAALVVGQQLRQVLAGGRLDRFGSAVLERAVDLVVQVDAVGDENNLELVDTSRGRSRARALASMTIVSDLPLPWVCQTTPPRRLPSVVAMPDAVQNLANAEVLLVAGDFLVAAVEQHIPLRQFDQSLRSAQGEEEAVLLGDFASPFRGELDRSNLLRLGEVTRRTTCRWTSGFKRLADGFFERPSSSPSSFQTAQYLALVPTVAYFASPTARASTSCTKPNSRGIS